MLSTTAEVSIKGHAELFVFAVNGRKTNRKLEQLTIWHLSFALNGRQISNTSDFVFTCCHDRPELFEQLSSDRREIAPCRSCQQRKRSSPASPFTPWKANRRPRSIIVVGWRPSRCHSKLLIDSWSATMLVHCCLVYKAFQHASFVVGLVKSKTSSS